MNIKRILATASAIVITLTAAACGTGTAETAYVPDYEEMSSMITTYEDSYRSFVMNGEGEVAYVTAEGVTPLGVPCSSRYRRSSDGAFESCSLTVERDAEEHDEYFNLGGNIMMFVRMYYDDQGAPVILKYISTGTEVYYMNTETQTCDLITDVEALDCFVTFDQVRRVYGIPVDTTETQLAA